jgi:hypothetical protein
MLCSTGTPYNVVEVLEMAVLLRPELLGRPGFVLYSKLLSVAQLWVLFLVHPLHVLSRTWCVNEHLSCVNLFVTKVFPDGTLALERSGTVVGTVVGLDLSSTTS